MRHEFHLQGELHGIRSPPESDSTSRAPVKQEASLTQLGAERRPHPPEAARPGRLHLSADSSERRESLLHPPHVQCLEAGCRTANRPVCQASIKPTAVCFTQAGFEAGQAAGQSNVPWISEASKPESLWGQPAGALKLRSSG